MSSRPMGWSRAGADRIGKLRAFYFNQGDFRNLVENQKVITQKKNHTNNVTREIGHGYEPKQANIAVFRASYTQYANAIKDLIKKI